MKKFLFILFILLIFCTASYAEGDFFDDYTGIDRAWDGQKPITNQEFEKAIDTLQAGQKKKDARKRKRMIRKISGGGTSLHPGLDPLSEIQAQDPLKNSEEEGCLLNIPVDIIIDGKTIERGFYNIYGEKDKDNNIYISLYQAQFLKGKIKAKETKNDYDADEISFAKFIPYNDEFVKIVFGSLKFNAYAYVRYKSAENLLQNNN